MRTVAAVLCLAALPAFAAPPKRVKAPADLPSLLALSRDYLRAESELSAEREREPLPTATVIAHLDELHAIALGFQKLERRGELRHLGEGRRTQVRHVLAQLLGQSTEIASEHMGDLLSAALERREKDLATLREVAQRSFDFELPSS